MKNVVYKDLIYVVIIGFLVATLTGIAVGTIDFLLYDLAGFTMNIFFFIGTYFIASYIRRQYVDSVKLYKIISVIVTIYGYFFSIVVFQTFILGLNAFEFIFKIVFSFRYMINFFNPTNVIDGGFGTVIEYLFIFIFGYIAYTKTKWLKVFSFNEY